MALDTSIAAALIGAAATLATAFLTLLFMRRDAQDPPSPVAPLHASNPQETILLPHVRDRSLALLDLRDLRETLDELIADHGGFTDIVYDGRRGELRLSFRWRAWDHSSLTARKASTGRHPPIFFEFFAPTNWPGSGPLELKLLLGKTSDGDRPFLMEIAKANPLFDIQQHSWPGKDDGSRWIFRRDFLPTSVRPNDRYTRLLRNWNAFIEEDLPRLISTFEQPLFS